MYESASITSEDSYDIVAIIEGHVKGTAGEPKLQRL